MLKFFIKLIFQENLTLMSKYCFTLIIKNIQYNFKLKLKYIFRYYELVITRNVFFKHIFLRDNIYI